MESFENSSIYNDAEKIENYWKNLQPGLDKSIVAGEGWKATVDLLEQVSLQHSVAVMIWNAVLHRFVFVVDKRNLVGHPSEAYLAEDGINFSISQMHSHTMDANLLMQQKAFEFFTPLTISEKKKMVTSFDGLYKTSTGDYIHFLQQAVCIETDNAGNGILFLSYIHDVSHLKKNKTSNLIIKMPKDISLWNFNFETRSLEKVHPLSKQEQKILLLLSKGNTSKEIAEDLFISALTVDTHRRNLLKKTNCIDTTAMITYAKLVGIL